MSHRYRKVYSESRAKAQPKTTTPITNSQKTAIIFSHIFSSIVAFLKKEWFPIASGLVNLVTVVVLILTWHSYLVANELNKQALWSSHMPVLKVTGLTLVPKGDNLFIISYVLSNNSSSPALNLRIHVEKTENGPFESKIFYDSGSSMPNSSGVLTFYCPNQREWYDGLTKGGAKIYFTMTFEDIFHRPYIIKQALSYDVDMKEFGDTSYEIVSPKD